VTTFGNIKTEWTNTLENKGYGNDHLIDCLIGPIYSKNGKEEDTAMIIKFIAL